MKEQKINAKKLKESDRKKEIDKDEKSPTIIRKQCFKHHPHRMRFYRLFCSVDFEHFTMIFVVYTEHNVEEQITLSECIMHVHRTNERTNNSMGNACTATFDNSARVLQ